MNRDYVYLISCQGFHKIGRAHNVYSRLATLQCGNPHQLDLVSSVLVDDAISFEAQLHQEYAESRIRGEWFELTDGDVADIKRIMSDCA